MKKHDLLALLVHLDFKNSLSLSKNLHDFTEEVYLHEMYN
jgi:hypothetical protein